MQLIFWSNLPQKCFDLAKKKIGVVQSLTVTRESYDSQSRSHALSLSPLPLFVVERTLVAAGHMTTQNLGGKKYVGWGGGGGGGWNSI